MPITIVPYDPTWPQKFLEEANMLRDLLGNLAVQIHHIGSTSVPGLAAKPIIDILLEVSNLYALDDHTDGFIKWGYEPKGAFGIPGRRYFRKGGDQRTHHIHAFRTGDPHLIRHLAFRDYLIAHPKVALAYVDIKKEAARRANHDIEAYGDVKGPFIRHHEQIALQWYANRK